jgi:hypothetical protein
VVDKRGNPVAAQRFYIHGEQLAPGAAVLREFRPHDDGTFQTADVPCKSFWFSPADGDLAGLKSNDLRFSRPGPYEVTLVFDRVTKELTAEISASPQSSAGEAASAATREGTRHNAGRYELKLKLDSGKVKVADVAIGQTALEVVNRCKPAKAYADDDPWLRYAAAAGGHYVLWYCAEGATQPGEG